METPQEEIEALKQGEERLRRILEATSEGWWEWDVPADRTYRSPGWFKMLGYPPAESFSSIEVWLSLIHPDDREAASAAQQAFMQQDSSWEIEFRMRTARNDYLWITSRGSVVARGPNGEAVRVVGIHINTSEKKKLLQLQEEYRSKAELLQGIIRVSHGAISIYDFISKRLVYASGLVYPKLGFTEEEFMQLSSNFFSQLLHPDDQPKLVDHLQQIQNATHNEVMECVLRFKSKAQTYHSILIKDSVYQRNKDGVVTQVVGSAQDITQYLELKDKLAENVQFLESLSFHNSHAVRGPVATLLGLVNLMKQELNSPSSLLELVTYLERTVVKLDTMILEFSDKVHSKIQKQANP